MLFDRFLAHKLARANSSVPAVDFCFDNRRARRCGVYNTAETVRFLRGRDSFQKIILVAWNSPNKHAYVDHVGNGWILMRVKNNGFARFSGNPAETYPPLDLDHPLETGGGKRAKCSFGKIKGKTTRLQR